MGIFDDKDDKTEEATPKRREEARKKGQVPWSQELSMATLMIAAILSVEIVGPDIIAALEEGLTKGLSVERAEASGVDWFDKTLRDSLWAVAPTIFPLLIALVVVAIVGGVLQVGYTPSTEKITPKLEKLDPVKGMGRIFSARGLMRAGMLALKLAVLSFVLWIALSAESQTLLTLPELDLPDAATKIAELALAVLWWIAIPLFILALIDVSYQRWQNARDMRMSKQEIRDENKQSEGDPEVKARIKRAQRDLARRRMMDEVPGAEVILTNPTHYAVALKYERGNMNAPRVVAKGTELVALRIREIARENNVPIVEDPPLARALFKNVDLGDEIPPEFYKPVAAILSEVMRLEQEVA